MSRCTLRVLVATPIFIAALAAVQAPLRSDSSTTWNRLYSNEASATSFLKNNWNKYTENYHPNYALDDRPETAWVEGVEGHGEQQNLMYRVSPLSVKLSIRNGYQKSKALFAKNSMPKDVIVSLHAPGMQTVAEKKFTLQKKWGFQDVSLPIPEERGFAFVKVTVLSVYPGSTYADTCVSDIRTFVDSQVAYNADVELAKQKQLDAWVKERFQTAKYFAALPKEYPFAGTQFDRHTAAMSSDAQATFASKRKELAAIQERLRGSKKWYRWVAADQIKLPDGLWRVEDLGRFLRLENLSFFEPRDNVELREHVRSAANKDFELGEAERWVSNIKQEAVSGTDSTPRYLYFWHKAIHEERTVYVTMSHYLLEYDQKGRLIRYFLTRNFDDRGEHMPGGTTELIKVVRFQWIGGRIAKILVEEMEESRRVTGSETTTSYRVSAYSPDT